MADRKKGHPCPVLYVPILCCRPSSHWSSCLSSSIITTAAVGSANFFLLQKSSVDFMEDDRLRHSPAHSCKNDIFWLVTAARGRYRTLHWLFSQPASSHSPSIRLIDVDVVVVASKCQKMQSRASERASERARSSYSPSHSSSDRNERSRRLHSLGSGSPRPSAVRGAGKGRSMVF